MDVGEFARRWLARTSMPLFVDDAIDPAPKRMGECLNTMAGPGTSVVAVEYSRCWQGNVEVLMPRVYGQELPEVKSKTERRELTQWAAANFRSWLVEHDSRSVHAFDGFLSAAGGARPGAVSLFYFNGRGTSIQFSFSHMSRMSQEKLPEESMRESFLG